METQILNEVKDAGAMHSSPLLLLCMIAQLHGIAVDVDSLTHELALTSETPVTFHHIESNPFSAFRSHPVFGIYEPVRFRHLQAS
jgi:hypothetical protein